MNYKTDFHSWLARVTRVDEDFICNLEVDFLAFATQGGANVQSQPDYAANSVVLTGYTSGIALSPQLNKTWRQGAFFSATLAQLMATVLNEDVIDDGVLVGSGKIQQMWRMLLQDAYFIDGGVANALLLNNPTSPAGSLTFSALKDGTEITVKIAATNTGAATLDWMGVVTNPIIHQDGLPLTGGEMVAGSLTKLAYIGGVWNLLTSALEPTVLGGNATFWVNASTGSDSNNGLSSGSAWLTLQHAWNWIQSNVNLNGHVVTVNCSGAFNAGVQAQGALLGASLGVASFVWQFASGSTINVTNSCCFIALLGAAFSIASTGGNLSLVASGTGPNQGVGIYAANGGGITTLSGIVFGNCDVSQVLANGSGALVTFTTGFTVAGTSARMLFAENNGEIQVVQTITVSVSGTTSYNNGIVVANFGGIVSITNTSFTGGAVTGQRFNAFANGLINTGSGDVNYIPGNVAGSTNLVGGVYGNGSGQYL